MPNCSLEPTPTSWRQDLAAERRERLDLPAIVGFFESGFRVVGQISGAVKLPGLEKRACCRALFVCF